MTFGIRTANDGTYAAITSGTEDVARFGGRNGDNSGQLAGFRNILINGKLGINQRKVTIAAAAIGSYGPDRWKKVDASNMTQIVEDGDYKYSSVYTLSGNGVTTQQLTSPASGNWTLPNIPIAATYVQLEEGSIATPFEHRPIGFEEMLCQRYYQKGTLTACGDGVMAYLNSASNLTTSMRATPTVTIADNVGTLGKVSADNTNNIAAQVYAMSAGSIRIQVNGVVIQANNIMVGTFTASAEL